MVVVITGHVVVVGGGGGGGVVVAGVGAVVPGGAGVWVSTVAGAVLVVTDRRSALFDARRRVAGVGAGGCVVVVACVGDGRVGGRMASTGGRR